MSKKTKLSSVGFFPDDPNMWEYEYFSKYEPRVQSSAGSQSEYLKVTGENPCGLGGYGLDNELCVKVDGVPCDVGNPPVIYYPNPADSLLAVDLSLQAYDIFTITIYDTQQVAVYTDQSENVIKTIATFNLANGIYYMHIHDSSNNLIFNSILIINH